MNKAESKYFNTAKLMNTALLLLLEKKEIDNITVKEICEKAGVNRSTFYLHYETIDDLLLETIENLNKEFKTRFFENVRADFWMFEKADRSRRYMETSCLSNPRDIDRKIGESEDADFRNWYGTKL